MDNFEGKQVFFRGRNSVNSDHQMKKGKESNWNLGAKILDKRAKNASESVNAQVAPDLELKWEQKTAAVKIAPSHL